MQKIWWFDLISIYIFLSSNINYVFFILCDAPLSDIKVDVFTKVKLLIEMHIHFPFDISVDDA